MGHTKGVQARWWGVVVAVGAAAVFLFCAAIGDALVRGHTRRARDAALYAVIRRTEGGFPHIEARTWQGLGYGFGYAFAQDDLCTMADDYVTVDGQRSRYFGPNGSYSQPGNGTTPNNLDSDLFWQQVIDSRVIDKLLAARSGPAALSPELREGVQGYVDGYNRYLRSVGGSAGVPDPRCRGQAWVHPITVADAYRRFYQLTELASGGVVIDGIAQAQPPTPSLPVLGAGELAHPDATGGILSDRLHDMHAGGVGSNAVAIGSAGTRDHEHGLLLGNPHFAWTGDERFYEFQYTIPGQLNVSGMTLFGVPIVLIGHTMSMAWSHTVSTAFRFTPYQLTLVPGDPTSYLEDGSP
jgi:acyl-homoserine-lactone acylase